MCSFLIISVSLSISIASVSPNGVELSPSPSVSLCVCVCVCVCRSGKCTVAKRLIGSGCCLVGVWDRSRHGCRLLDDGGDHQRGRGCFGWIWASHCNQRGLCCILVWDRHVLLKWFWGVLVVVGSNVGCRYHRCSNLLLVWYCWGCGMYSMDVWFCDIRSFPFLYCCWC